MFRTCTIMFISLILGLMTSVAGQAPDFRHIMITEVSWLDPQGIEITNFSVAPIDLTNWTVAWIAPPGSGPPQSVTLNGMILPGEVILVTEMSPTAIPEAPPATRVLPLLPVQGVYTSAINFALLNALGQLVDDVNITSTSGTSTLPVFSGSVFRGLALRSSASAASVERIWGLDSNAGRDWTEETVRSFGLESRSSGVRGTDVSTEPRIIFTEIDDSPDYIELRNNGNLGVNLRDFVILASGDQGASLTRILPFPSSFTLPASGFVIIGDTASSPAEKPSSVPYVDLSAIGGGNLPMTSEEFTLALYDNLGRLLDLVRVTGGDNGVVHNHPRAPSHWSAFVGAAARQSGIGEGSLGVPQLITTYQDSDRGSDWRGLFTRSMGSYNPLWVGSSGLGDAFDVRMNATPLGSGMTIIMNGGNSAAGARYSFLFNLGHLSGAGPFFGLGPEALLNWQLILASPPFTGLLDARGSGRVDLPSGSLPTGIQADCIFILQNAAGALLRRTAIIQYDT